MPGTSPSGSPNGLEALERLEHDPLPSLVLLDLHMPIMDGREFPPAPAGLPRGFRDLPVIIVSADRPAATAAIDAEYVLRKPFTAESLEHAVRNAFAALGAEYTPCSSASRTSIDRVARHHDGQQERDRQSADLRADELGFSGA